MPDPEILSACQNYTNRIPEIACCPGRGIDQSRFMWNLPPIKPSGVTDEDGSILGRRGGSRCPAFSRRQEDGSKGSALRGMVPSPAPKRDHGDPQAFRLRSARAKVDLVRAGGLEPPRALRPNGFSYPSTAFAAPAVLQQGLGSGLSLHRVPDVFPVVRCCPSSLYTFPAGKLIAPAGLGSGSPCYRVPRI